MSERCNVLLIDDDENDRFLFASALNETQLDVHLAEAPDGYKGMHHLLTESPQPDAVFLDLKLPGMGGLDTLERIRSHAELDALTVFVLTASQSPEDVGRARLLGADGVYKKPCHYSDLVVLLQTVLGPMCNRPCADCHRQSNDR